MLGLAGGALLVLFAPALASLFVHDAWETRQMTALGLRIFAGGLIPCCINNALKYAYQASERVWLTELISVLEGMVFPALAAFVFSRFMGTAGVWLGFAAGEILTLLTLGILIFRTTREKPWKNGAFLLLGEDFGAGPDRTLEAEIASMEEVAAVSEAARQFCLRHGQDTRISSHIALCIEEMAGNVIQHGFSAEGKGHHLFIRILDKPDQWVLRFRDDCRAFDPLHFIPREEGQGLGIRLVLAMAEEAHYTYSMNLNNLVLKMPKK